MYNTVISAACKAGEWRTALELYDHLLCENGLNPDRTSETLTISALMKGRQFTIAAAIKDKSYIPGEINLCDKVIVPSRTFSSHFSPQMIIELENLTFTSSRSSGAMQWSDIAVQFSESDGIMSLKRDEVAISDGDNDDNDSKEFMKQQVIDSNEWTAKDKMILQTLVPMELKDEKWINQVTTPDGVVGRVSTPEDKVLYQPNTSVDVILKALQTVGRFEVAIELIEKLKVEGIAPTASHYNSAIKACGEVGNWESAVALLDHMTEKNIPRSSVTFSLLTDILWQYWYYFS